MMRNNKRHYGGHDNEAISLSSLDISSDDNTPDSGIDEGQPSDRKCPPVDTRSVYSDEEGYTYIQSRSWMNIDKCTARIKRFATKNRKAIVNSIWTIILLGYIGYLTYACFLNLNDATAILSITGVVLFFYIYAFVRDHFGDIIWEKCCIPTSDILSAVWDVGKGVIIFIVLAGIAIGLYFLCRDNPKQLISAFGLVVFVIFTFITSKYPKQVKWRPVIWGLALQIIFAFIILQTDVGFKAFDWLGDVVHKFLNYSDEGAKFVFGDPMYLDHPFAFQALPVVIYFSTCISVLYNWGAMQFIIKKIAWLMERTMKTSASESLNAGGNIFVGQTEAPLLIKPMLKDMTMSELHAVMTGGFATIAGSVFGAYVSFGISPSHLLSASVMSAPAALAIAKLSYPETEESKFKDSDQLNLPKGEYRNVIEAASHGAATAVSLVLNIAANLMAFIAVLALLNGILGYLGALVGVEELSFEFICSYLFSPLAFLIGVEWDDCLEVAELLGLKIFLNEFVAYERLSELMDNRLAGIEPKISIRSEILATYALCGFGNLSSIGIQLGGLTPLAPERSSDLAKVAMRALIAGTTACFMTACVAGVLLDGSDNSQEAANFTSTILPTTIT